MTVEPYFEGVDEETLKDNVSRKIIQN